MNQHWWQKPDIQNWSIRAWRYYSWRPTYRLTLTTSERTAYVNMRDKLVVCNPEYPYPPLNYRSGVRGLPKDVRQFQVAYLESLIAHEAGHTHHTGELPPGLLGQLVNIIEDERMERKMAQTFPTLKPLFQLAADADAAHTIASSGKGGDIIGGCLLHRFTHHHPQWAYLPDGPDRHHWPEVRTILEAVWDADTYEEVIQAAKRILSIVGVPENAPRRDDLDKRLDGQGMNLEGSPGQGGNKQGQGGGPGGGDDEGESGDEEDSGNGPEDGDGPGQGPGGGQGHQDAGGPPQRPTPEQLPTSNTLQLQQQTQGMSRHIAQLLKRKGAPARTHQSRDRGRFRYDRYATGSERYFDQRVGAQAPGQTHLRIAVDISGSMSGSRMDAARTLTFALIEAARLADVPVLAYAFDDRVDVIADQKLRGVTSLNTAARLGARGGTFLAPALTRLWQPQLEGQSLTFIITDGGIDASDEQRCRKLYEAHTGMVVPVFLSHATHNAQYERLFGQCVTLPPEDLQTHIVSFLKAFLAKAAS